MQATSDILPQAPRATKLGIYRLAMTSKGWGFTRGSGRLPRPTFALPTLDREQREFLRQIAQVRAALGEDGVKAFLAETEKRQRSTK